MGTEKERIYTVHMDKVKHFISDCTLPLRGEEPSFQENDEPLPEEDREMSPPPEIPAEETVAPPEQPILRRSTRQRKPNPRYDDYVTH
ncbi:hypothetical protein DdX_10706 [Ditylenchus destructor]|uniref:Uncharacterized protein n=1 Tax=Ditylenchus destructor TaxID=166010 RepID=A0AAD4N3R5_9BILA|nr:hypothetical protein DdX_10706 [Ditylenchus destructor]